jgi:hypothetical protein
MSAALQRPFIFSCDHVLNIVLLLPPAPAALVLDGRALATLSARSAAAFLLIAVAGPPGALGDDGRAVVVPEEGVLIGDEGRGEDYFAGQYYFYWVLACWELCARLRQVPFGSAMPSVDMLRWRKWCLVVRARETYHCEEVCCGRAGSRR